VMVMVAVGAEEGEGAAVMTVDSLEGTWAWGDLVEARTAAGLEGVGSSSEEEEESGEKEGGWRWGNGQGCSKGTRWDVWEEIAGKGRWKGRQKASAPDFGKCADKGHKTDRKRKRRKMTRKTKRMSSKTKKKRLMEKKRTSD
jgi:hypothetical protein